MAFIPVYEPWLTEQDARSVSDCVRGGWVSSAGPLLEEFERRWALYCGRRFGVSVSSGTAALRLALAALDLKPGDEVILPSFTIISCALAVMRAGAVPVLVDSEPRTWCMDASKVSGKISGRTRAILAVHIYGHPADMNPLLALARERGLALIEDAAEAHGAMYRDAQGSWRRCGSFGHSSCFSFYANKPVTTGEGGMILTDDERLAERFRSLRNLCFQGSRRFRHEDLGFNFRLSSVQAALGLSQLDRMDEIVARRRAIGEGYARRLMEVPGLELPVEEPWASNIYWVYGIVVREETGLDAPRLAASLRELGVETRPFFLGMHEQPVLRARGLFAGQSFPVAERLARRGLYLPSGLTLTEAQQDEVCAALRRALS